MPSSLKSCSLLSCLSLSLDARSSSWYARALMLPLNSLCMSAPICLSMASPAAVSALSSSTRRFQSIMDTGSCVLSLSTFLPSANPAWSILSSWPLTRAHSRATAALRPSVKASRRLSTPLRASPRLAMAPKVRSAAACSVSFCASNFARTSPRRRPIRDLRLWENSASCLWSTACLSSTTFTSLSRRKTSLRSLLGFQRRCAVDALRGVGSKTL
mmetsp:Transcript_18497/g.46640  ORF Transcript_18497/g.46640 Transcript_18497/m.46640 type:complete len:215 (+) Transcript_18497:60-704(+)